MQELFVLVARAGLDNVKLIIAPHDLRLAAPEAGADAASEWVAELYEQVRGEMVKLIPPGAQ